MSARKPGHQHRRKYFVSWDGMEMVHQCKCGALRVDENHPWRSMEAFMLEYPLQPCQQHRASQNISWIVASQGDESPGGLRSFPVCRKCGYLQDPRGDWTDFEHMVRRYPPKGETAEEILGRWPPPATSCACGRGEQCCRNGKGGGGSDGRGWCVHDV